MRSFHHQPDNRRSIFLNLAGAIEGQLRQAFAKRSEKDGLTQAALADKIGVDRSAVNRRLSGGSNMTIETIADMVWGLDYCIRVELFDPAEEQTNGFFIRPEPVVETVVILPTTNPPTTVSFSTGAAPTQLSGVFSYNASVIPVTTLEHVK